MSAGRLYRIREFAGLAGVTVKALRHYDRMGLLSPKRNAAGYRAYTEHDLERLEQIVALKFLGLPLRQIKVVLGETALELPAALRSQRKAIERLQERLARAVQAISAAERSIHPGQPADPAVLKKIIEVISMTQDIEIMKKYYSAESWERHRRYYENGPAPEWRQLYRDVNALIGEDPGSAAAQALADRWLSLSIRAQSGDPDLQTGSPMAWLDRQNWPPAMKQRIAEFNLEGVSEFMKSAVLSARKKYFSDGAWARFAELRRRMWEDTGARSASWQAQVDLFRDVEAAWCEDPAGDSGQRLARRWTEQLEQESSGDAEIRQALARMWKDRQGWSATLRWCIEGSYRMTGERFDRAADFIDRAVAARGMA